MNNDLMQANPYELLMELRLRIYGEFNDDNDEKYQRQLEIAYEALEKLKKYW